ncbi:hypothetical protein MK489_10760 [Myxococcota bacterium]|nr:hypothetical protein [Myxococcota bacterium]
MATSSTPRLFWVVYPVEDQRIGLGGVEVLVRFAPGREIDFDSFRVFLNQADVTRHFTLGTNGAHGFLVALLDGVNWLQFELRGNRGGFPSVELLDSRKLRLRMRPQVNLDRV